MAPIRVALDPEGLLRVDPGCFVTACWARPGRGQEAACASPGGRSAITESTQRAVAAAQKHNRTTEADPAQE